MAYPIVFFCLCGDFELVVDNCFTGQVKYLYQLYTEMLIWYSLPCEQVSPSNRNTLNRRSRLLKLLLGIGISMMCSDI